MEKWQTMLTKAALVTLNNPTLWWFGLVLLGGLNIQWLLASTPVPLWAARYVRIWQSLVEMQHHFAHPILWWSFVIAGAVLLLIITCWAKILLIMVSASILKLPFIDKEEVGRFRSVWQVVWFVRKYLERVLIINVLVIVFVSLLIVVIGLPGVYQFLLQGLPPGSLVVLSVISILLVLFGAVFAQLSVLFSLLPGLRVGNALRAAWDLIRMRPMKVSLFFLSVFACYAISFLVGSAIFFYVRLAVKLLPHGSLIIVVTQTVTLAYVVWLALLNVFYNVAFVIFFGSIVRQGRVDGSELMPKKAPMPVVS